MKTFLTKHLKSVILYILILFNVTSGAAQTIIKGVVKDLESGEPLIGANIFSKEDPSSGTICDYEGNYSFEVSSKTTVLVFSYAGYGSKEEVINGRTQIDVNLSAGQLLEDVVIIGYGTVKREDATGSVQTVSSANFNRGAITGPQELLAGFLVFYAVISISVFGPLDTTVELCE